MPSELINSLPELLNTSADAKIHVLNNIVGHIKNDPSISQVDRQMLDKIEEIISKELPKMEHDEFQDDIRADVANRQAERECKFRIPFKNIFI